MSLISNTCRYPRDLAITKKKERLKKFESTNGCLDSCVEK